MRGREAGLSIRPASLFRTSSLLQISVGKAALCLQRIVGVDGRSGLGGGNDVRSQKKSFPVPGRHDFRTTISEKNMLTLFGRPVFRKSVRRRSEADVRSGKAGERVAWRCRPARLFYALTGLFKKPEFIGGSCGCGMRRQEERQFVVLDAVSVCFEMLRATAFPGTGTDFCSLPRAGVLLL